MHGITVQNIHLDRVLAPLVGTLDQCWWYLDGTGMSLPSIRPPARVPAPPAGEGARGRRGPGRHSHAPPARFDPADWQRFMNETRAAQAEYERWVVQLGHERFGKPGFFSRYAAGMDKNWKMFFASDAPTLEQAGLAEAARLFDHDWFDSPPAELPSDICLITRDVDAAYLDLFFRDDWMCRSVLGHAAAHRIKASPFRNAFAQPRAGDAR